MAADTGTTLASWLSTSASNTPAGTTFVSTNLDDNLREIQGVVVRGLSHKGADIVSAATTDIGAIEGLMHDITGTVTITSFGTVRAGIWKILKFEGILTLTHNATTLILLSGANRTTANGAIGIYISEGSGNWREVSFEDVAMTGSATYNPPSLADAVGTTTTVTVTGAALGDFAEASFSLDLQGITLTAWVSAANTVSVRFQNESGVLVDLASGTLRARATKA